ncbi:HlyD family secretion protein [Dyella nitratireducens]|uniref:Multidrug export protein EmrA n=1 Tax=Dyella nitratireducens TaxID=1849580 RepID=A0ABQ1GDW7_9GAMM|nr:HlyD family secretion protein [Dyella nitratireducens]GGA41956.1 multidrug export protein EmrA [Dyella nitratireducens]GLQ42072.1 multidrug export protein EmrA [Dyella nitratireducens]
MSNTETQEGAKPRALPRKTRIAAGVIAAVLVVVSGVAYAVMSGREVSTDDAYTDGRAITIAPHVAGYVAELNVTDNEFVHQGQVLVRIQCTDYLATRDHAQGALESAEGQLAAAQTDLALAKITYPERLSAAQATLATERANLFKAQSEFLRQHDIPKEATTSHDIDFATANRNAAEGDVAQAQAQARIAQPVNLNIDDAQAHVEQLQGEVKLAQGDLDQAKLNVGYCDVVAPQDGWVTKRGVEKGDYIQVGQQLFAIVSPEVWVTANFKETQLAHMRPGQHVSMTIDAYPNLKLKGHVDSIQEGSGGKFTAFPAENATGNFVKIVQRVPVKIVIDSGLNPKQPLPLNLSVEPTVELQ